MIIVIYFVYFMWFIVVHISMSTRSPFLDFVIDESKRTRDTTNQLGARIVSISKHLCNEARIGCMRNPIEIYKYIKCFQRSRIDFSKKNSIICHRNVHENGSNCFNREPHNYLFIEWIVCGDGQISEIRRRESTIRTIYVSMAITSD